MRTLLLATLTLSALQNPADACGSYVREPAVLQLTSHYTRTGVRTFVMLNERVPENVRWREMAPGTYDYSRIAQGSSTRAQEFTLVGPSGTKVVSTSSRWFIDSTMGPRKQFAALEIADKGDFRIALPGRHTDITWSGMGGEKTGSAADIAWLASQKIVPAESAYVGVSKLHGTEFEAVSLMTNDGHVTFVRSGRTVIAQLTGSVVGVLSTKGERFIVSSHDGAMSTAHIYVY
jgi:hypothetical protein